MAQARRPRHRHIRCPDGEAPPLTDAFFADPRLAALYDALDGPRTDLDAYVAIVEEIGARSVLDVGCGTGSLACRLAALGVAVVAVDPAAASLDLAQRKPGAEHVRWIHGNAAAVPDDVEVDLATMTGNVAQVFATDVDWTTTLDAIRARIRPGGWLVFETRDPSARAWERWTKEHTLRTLSVPGVGEVTTWTDLIDVAEPRVSFRHTFHFESDRIELTSDSTLRFRNRDELAATLRAAGFELHAIRDASDRPGLELVVLAQTARA